MAITSDDPLKGGLDGGTEVLDDPLGEMLSDLLEAESDPTGDREWTGIPLEADPVAERPNGPIGPSAPTEVVQFNPPQADAGGDVFSGPYADYQEMPEPSARSDIYHIAERIMRPLEPDDAARDVQAPEVWEPPVDAPAPPAPELVAEPVEAPHVAEPASIGTAAGPSEPKAEPEPDMPASVELDTLISAIDLEAGPGFQSELGFEEEAPRRKAVGGDSCIVFSLAGTRYAIPVRSVLEMDATPRTTPVPNVPGFVRGVTNLRGEILAVLDLRNLLGLEQRDSHEGGRILVVRTTDQQTAALAVDDVRGTTAVALAELVQPASPVHDKVASVLIGVGEHQNHVLNVLDVDKLFRIPEMHQFAIN